VLLMDIRHPLQEFDTTMLNWAAEVNMPVHILLTKADKLSRGNAGSVLLDVKNELKKAKLDNLVTAQTFSALKLSGIDALKLKLGEWLLPKDKSVATTP
jgi:GTP-binding protein